MNVRISHLFFLATIFRLFRLEGLFLQRQPNWAPYRWFAFNIGQNVNSSLPEPSFYIFIYASFNFGYHHEIIKVATPLVQPVSELSVLTAFHISNILLVRFSIYPYHAHLFLNYDKLLHAFCDHYVIALPGPITAMTYPNCPFYGSLLHRQSKLQLIPPWLPTDSIISSRRNLEWEDCQLNKAALVCLNCPLSPKQMICPLFYLAAKWIIRTNQKFFLQPFLFINFTFLDIICEMVLTWSNQSNGSRSC